MFQVLGERHLEEIVKLAEPNMKCIFGKITETVQI